ncbi:FRG domain-containing protein [Spirosoma panaciterrae]|uniref:FRG domain-containing protein n=1 Tax=Spirosoma panaciterrae TaxID=496058 RepID=UPI0003761C1E|nr:FRG domain-containing protein [Spirosoma panaciterrae]
MTTPHSRYRESYQIYRRLVNHLCDSTNKKESAIDLADYILSQKDLQQIQWQAKYCGLFEALEPHWNDINKIHEVTLELTGGRHENNPLPDVYAAALSMRMFDVWKCEPSVSVYRGQRNYKWSTIPSIYRFTSDKREYYKTRLQNFVHFLREEYPKFSKTQCVAIAQHFSADDEGDTKTHLVDITWDPFVALFFASDGGKKGDIGVVNRIIVPEWKKYIANELSHRGNIEIIEVDGVQRIKNQRALFLSTPDPKSFDLYHPWKIFFKQHDGVVFDDLEYEQPLSNNTLYPIEGFMKDLLIKFKKTTFDSIKDLPSISIPSTNEVYGKEYLLERAKQMIPNIENWIPANLSVLKICAEFYARGEEWSEDKTLYSLHRWNECLRLIGISDEDNQIRTVEDSIQFTLSRIKDEKEVTKVLDFAKNIEANNF